MHVSWWTFFLITILFYAFNALAFSGLYWVTRDQFDPNITLYVDTLFYSGGRMVGLDGRFDPVGLGGSSVALCQAFLALLFGAMLTGLLYARFSSPSSSLTFSKYCCISKHRGRDALLFRICNSRRGRIHTAQCEVYALVRKSDSGGQIWTTLKKLRLARDALPVIDMFPWTVVHYLDGKGEEEGGGEKEGEENGGDYEESPLSKSSWDSVCEEVDSIVVHAQGEDTTVNASIFAEQRYPIEEIKINCKPKDMMSFQQHPSKPNLRTQTVNYKYFHDVEPSPSDRYVDMAAFGGASSTLDIQSDGSV